MDEMPRQTTAFDTRAPRLDTAPAVSVPGPHDPMHEPEDALLRDYLVQFREQALLERDAHARELEAQTNFHTAEIARRDRIAAACSDALTQLDQQAPQEQVPAPRSEAGVRY